MKKNPAITENTMAIVKRNPLTRLKTRNRPSNPDDIINEIPAHMRLFLEREIDIVLCSESVGLKVLTYNHVSAKKITDKSAYLT